MYNGMKHRLRDYFDSEEEVLHACIRDGDLPQLKQLLCDSPAPGINYSHPGFGPPVHFAALCGNLDAVELLLAAGADPLLFSYATHGHAAVVEDFLDWWDGWSQDLKIEALLWASRRWHFGVATLLLNKALFEKSTLQEALHIATNKRFMLSDEFKVKCEGIDYLNQQLLIALLIDAGASPNSCPNNTPLIYSVAWNENLTSALKTMLEKGADPNMTNASGKSTLHVLAEPLSMGEGRSDDFNETAIRLLLQYNASVSQSDNAGECPLHWAAYGLDLRLFCLYLFSHPDRGRDVLLQLTNHEGETLLHFAAAGCRIEVIEFLIAQGLDVNAKNSNGWTPLMCALIPIDRNPYIPIKSPAEAMRAARYLLSHGADVNITTDEGWTPLHGVALHRDRDVSGKVADFTKDLISHGAYPEACARLLSPDTNEVVPSLGVPWGYRLRDAMVNPSSQRVIIRPALTPLYWAAERGAVGVIRTLLAHGVDVSSMDVDGISPTRMAAESKFLERHPGIADDLIGLLLAAGAGF